MRRDLASEHSDWWDVHLWATLYKAMNLYTL